MCIAIYKPADQVIDHDTLRRSYEANPDGCGMAYLTDDGIEIETTMDFDVFYEGYEQALREYPDSPFLIHFRIATHGSVDENNCHPFYIESHHEDVQRVFMHNGTITPLTGECNKVSGVSDTVVFGLAILEHLPLGWEDNPAITKLIEHYIGWSKIVVMDEFGAVTIYNEQKGVWDNGVWYSNTTYKPKPVMLPMHKPSVDYYKNPHWYMQCDFCDKWVDNTNKYLADGDKEPVLLCFDCKWDFEKYGINLHRVSDFRKAI